MKSCCVLLVILLLVACNPWNKNGDNTIYKIGRKYFFRVNHYNADSTLKKTDSLVMEVANGFYPGPSQTEIIYTYFQAIGKDTLRLSEATGVVDSKNEFFIHPPRVGDLYILSFVDFPDFSTKVFTDSTYSSKGEGAIIMSKTYQGKLVTKVKTAANYEGVKYINLPVESNLRTYHKKSSSSSEIGNILGNYYFNEKYGFVKLDYLLPDSTQIQIELTGTDLSKSQQY